MLEINLSSAILTCAACITATPPTLSSFHCILSRPVLPYINQSFLIGMGKSGHLNALTTLQSLDAKIAAWDEVDAYYHGCGMP